MSWFLHSSIGQGSNWSLRPRLSHSEAAFTRYPHDVKKDEKCERQASPSHENGMFSLEDFENGII